MLSEREKKRQLRLLRPVLSCCFYLLTFLDFLNYYCSPCWPACRFVHLSPVCLRTYVCTWSEGRECVYAWEPRSAFLSSNPFFVSLSLSVDFIANSFLFLILDCNMGCCASLSLFFSPFLLLLFFFFGDGWRFLARSFVISCSGSRVKSKRKRHQ